MFSYTDVIDYPSAVQLIDDSDAPTATNFNTGPEGLANRTAWLHVQVDPLADLTALAAEDVTMLNGAILRTVTDIGDGTPGLYYYNASNADTPETPYIVAPGAGAGNWLLTSSDQIAAQAVSIFISPLGVVAPAWAKYALVFGMGGGGGGGGSTNGDTVQPGVSGGGGGGAQPRTVLVPVTAGTTYTVTIGIGGTGGAAQTSGTDGASTTFGSLLTFFGGMGGTGYNGVYSSSNMVHGGLGETVIGLGVYRGVIGTSSLMATTRPPGTGGMGTNNISFGFRKGASAGGAGSGGDSAYGAGGGGGGGNGGWFGGTGGSGGAAAPAPAGTSFVGLPGTLGCGGGGGGAGDLNSGGIGGGNGGPGYLIVVWLR